ncbi:hypothetical protein O1R50_04830 [Glycomyces luteolus]|uniref:Uncharacterized protein n=1 Tax=Glycomyces luteolus TaxID=2670330 RepID=A0A9X3SS18_9ACTN|nr:hypothetical protein [Glycomyces luteolus]MDA1358933.1 hypothetical protein [Glycomyces luteolus]
MNAMQRRPGAVRLLALAVLTAAWVAVLAWLWADETSLSCFEYAPSEGADSGRTCAELAEREMRRFNAWFAPALICGPVAGIALWFTLRPRRAGAPR